MMMATFCFLELLSFCMKKHFFVVVSFDFLKYCIHKYRNPFLTLNFCSSSCFLLCNFFLP